MSDLDAFVGVWELDPTTLNYEHGMPGRRAIYEIEAIGDGLQFKLDAHDAAGNPMRVVYGGPIDGRDVPYANTNITVALNRLDQNTIESIAKKEGQVIDRWTRTLSQDGQTMTITQHGVAPDGAAFKNTGTYRRIRRIEQKL